MPSANELSRLFSVDGPSLRARKEYQRLGPKDARLLLQALPWARRVAPRISREFYDWQFSFGPTRRFLGERARERGQTLEQLRGMLERSQVAYFVEVFAGARTEWDLDYFERRMLVGKLHDRIDVPPKWYIGAYGESMRIVRRALRRRLLSPWKRSRLEAAIHKVFLLDMQAVMDAYILSLFQSMGLRLAGRAVSGEEDLSDQFGALKREVQGALAEMRKSKDDLRATVAELEMESGRISKFVALLNQTCSNLGATHGAVVAHTEEAAEISGRGVATSQQSMSVVAELGAESKGVDGSIKLIRQISNQTSLLAINASVEAVRAGNEGRGFAVVAREVGDLAGVTKDASAEIERRIASIAGGAQGGPIHAECDRDDREGRLPGYVRGPGDRRAGRESPYPRLGGAGRGDRRRGHGARCGQAA